MENEEHSGLWKTWPVPDFSFVPDFSLRADDAKKGGDIDLYVELPPEDYDYAKKVRFWCELVKHLGDQKIDVVINKTGASPHLPIHDVARTRGVKL